MTRQIDSKLDNPVWFSLSESHQPFSINYDHIKFYRPDCCPFGACEYAGNFSRKLEAYAHLLNEYFIVGIKPVLPYTLQIKKELVCLQMIINNPIPMEASARVTALTSEHSEKLFQLINLVQPGYFKKNTHQLGSYVGIFKNGDLVAAAGERMKMNDFVEVSAIVTHPDHTGSGYATQLIGQIVNEIFKQGKKPYLHVAETNSKAIALYNKLGFVIRRKITFWNVMKKPS